MSLASLGRIILLLAMSIAAAAATAQKAAEQTMKDAAVPSMPADEAPQP